ncbi:MAG: glycerophosphodiester phosphodiesterase family protein, partial [Erysipelotrichaceae bacterium]
MELVFALVTLFFAYFLMVRINSDRVRKLSFMRIPAAHRGLYTKDQSVPENSLAAFRLAVEHGYAIELDVQCSKDLEVFVFHDSTLQRMCDRPEHLEELDTETLHTLKLGSTEEKIPTFREMLALVDGKVPLWIE